MAIVRDEYIRTEWDDGRIDCHRAVTGLCTGRSDAAAASIARMIGARMHIGDPAHRPFCFTGLHDARRTIRENLGMSDDSLHDLAVGDEFIDLHFPFARDSLLYDDLLILPEASIVPLIIVDRHRLLAEDLPRGIRNDVDLHAFLHLHQTIFDRHHLLPVEARVIHHALHRLLRRIDDLFLAIRDDGNRHCPLHHDDRAIRDLLRACPECVIRLQ